MTKRSSIGSRVRNKLADITNSKTIKPHIDDVKPLETLQPNKDFIDQLVKENMALMKLIAERNKIIDLSGAELQKLRISLQKLQLQNWHLAQSNSRFLAEINLGREKIKSLEHEIVCKEALRKAKGLDVEGKAEMNNGNTASQEGEQATEHPSHKVNNERKACNRNRKLATRIKSRSMGPSTSYSTVADKEVENKRHRVRRQSARFKSQVGDNEENLFEIEDAKFPAVSQPPNTPMNINMPSQSNSAPGEEERNNKNSSSPRWEAPALQRFSIGRPIRRAAEKVQSYKEARVNVKMRREE